MITNKQMLGAAMDIMKKIDEVQPFVLKENQSFELKLNTGEEYYMCFVHWQNEAPGEPIKCEQLTVSYVWASQGLDQIVSIMDYLNKIEEDSF